MTEARTHEKGAVTAILSMAALVLWLGYDRPASLQVPSFVAYLCAFTLTMAAFALYAKATGRTAGNNAFAALTLLGFAATGAWIALAPAGMQGCKAGFTTSRVDAASRQLSNASSYSCRIAFGLGAVICLLMAAWALALWCRPAESRRSG